MTDTQPPTRMFLRPKERPTTREKSMFSPDADIKVEEEKKEFDKATRIEIPGDYVCEVIEARFKERSAQNGEAYFIKMKVLSGPAYVGETVEWSKWFRLIYETWVDPKNPKRRFTADQKKLGDRNQVQFAFAAVLGLEPKDAGKLADGQQFGGEFEKAFTGDASTIAGRKVIYQAFNSKPRESDGKVFVNAKLLPFNGDVVTAVKVHNVPVKAPPALPGKPAAPSLQDVLKKHGFQVHPSDSDFVFNETTEEVLSMVDFKARFCL